MFVPKRVDHLSAEKHKLHHLASFIFRSSEEDIDSVDEQMHANQLDGTVISV